jgi:hypothetical protein
VTLICKVHKFNEAKIRLDSQFRPGKHMGTNLDFQTLVEAGYIGKRLGKAQDKM